MDLYAQKAETQPDPDIFRMELCAPMRTVACNAMEYVGTVAICLRTGRTMVSASAAPHKPTDLERYLDGTSPGWRDAF